jgi:hypothetical protein
MSDADWWQPFGRPGRAAVRELLDPAVWQRYFAADPELELDLGRTDLGAHALDLRARRLLRVVRCAGQDCACRTLATLDLSGPPDPTGGWDKSLTVLDTPGRVARRTDDSRRSRLRGALRYLHVAVGDRSWVWHFEGGRVAGVRLVLRFGDHPADAGEPVVVTHPSALGRSLGSLSGGATADMRVVTWTESAAPVDVVVAELCAMSKLDRLVDYRASRVAEGFSELLDHLPRAEGNTE